MVWNCIKIGEIAKNGMEIGSMQLEILRLKSSKNHQKLAKTSWNWSFSKYPIELNINFNLFI